MEQWKRELLVLWIGVLLASSSYTMVVPFLPLYLFDLGVTPQRVNLWSGLVFSSSFLFAALLAPYWGAKADRHGKRRMVLRAGFCLAVVYFLGAFVRTPWELLLVRILQGIAGGFVPASLTIVASTVPQDRMGWGLGLMQTASATGSILGPLFGGLWSHYFSMRLSFVAAAAAIFTATLAVRFLVQEKEVAEDLAPTSFVQSLRAVHSNKVLLLILSVLLVVQITVMIRQPITTLFVKDLAVGSDLDSITLYSGIIFSLSGVSGMIAAPFWGNFGQNRGFHRTLLYLLLVSGLINILHLGISTIWQFALLQFVFGLFLAGIYPAVNSLLVKHTDLDFRGRAFGLATTANQFGQMVGPILGGVASTWLSYPWLFVLAGLLLISASAATWRSRIRANKN